jgi:hypothetical protein
MAVHDTLKQEVKYFKKSLIEGSEKLESKMGRHGSDIQKLQKNMKTALKGKWLKRSG